MLLPTAGEGLQSLAPVVCWGLLVCGLAQLPHLRGQPGCSVDLPWARLPRGRQRWPAVARLWECLDAPALCPCCGPGRNQGVFPSSKRRVISGHQVWLWVFVPGPVGEKEPHQRRTPHTWRWFREVGVKPQGPAQCQGQRPSLWVRGFSFLLADLPGAPSGGLPRWSWRRGVKVSESPALMARSAPITQIPDASLFFPFTGVRTRGPHWWVGRRQEPRGWCLSPGLCGVPEPGPGSPFTASEPRAGRSHYPRSCRAAWRRDAGPPPEL